MTEADDLNASFDSFKQLRKEDDLEEWVKVWHKCSDLGTELQKFLKRKDKMGHEVPN